MSIALAMQSFFSSFNQGFRPDKPRVFNKAEQADISFYWNTLLFTDYLENTEAQKLQQFVAASSHAKTL